MTLRSRVSWNSIATFFSLTGIRIIKFIGSVVFVNIAGSFAVGIYFVFISVYRITNRATTLGMGQVIVKRVSEQKHFETNEVTNIVLTAFLLRSTPLIIITAALAIFQIRLDRYIGINHAWLFVAASLWLTAIYSTFRSTLIGQRDIDTASGFDFFKESGTAALQITLILIGFAQWGLIIGFVIGLSISALSVMAYARIPFHQGTIEFGRIKSIFSFGKFSYLDNLVGGEHRWVDILILGFFVSADSIGVYGIVYGLARFGDLFSAALARNVLPEVSHLSSVNSKSTREKLLYRTLTYSTIFPIPMLVGSYLIADRLLLDIYSMGSGAGSLIVLTAGMVVYGAYQQLHQLIYAFDKPDFAFMLSALSSLVNAIIAVTLVPIIGILGAAISTSLSMAVSFVIGIYVTRNQEEFSLRLPIGPWAIQAGCAIAMGIVVYFVQSNFVLQTRFYSAILVFVGASVYLTLIVSIDSFLREELFNFLVEVQPR